MRIYVIVDENMGMLFQDKRQSRDRILIDDMIKDAKVLWMDGYSKELFVEKYPDKIMADEDFLEYADANACCFVEKKELLPYMDKIDSLVIYRWNRVYPSDKCFDLSFDGWELINTEEFKGSSHKKITKETWRKSRCL